jgi:phosphate/sulfate permease
MNTSHLILVISVVAIALLFDFINGFHDAANSIATIFGIPVSTTHTITGAIVGVGSVSNPGRVRWGVASRILWAWVFTIPASAAIAAVTHFVARALRV